MNRLALLLCLSVLISFGHAVEPTILRQKCWEAMKLAGIDANIDQITVKPIEQGWQANCDDKNVIARFDRHGSLIGYARMVTPSGEGLSMPIAALWSAGEKFAQKLRSPGLPLRRIEKPTTQDTHGQVRLEWVEAKDGRPNAATTTVTLNAYTAEPIWYAAIQSKSYGPDKPALTVPEAKAKLDQLIGEASRLKPNDANALERAHSSFKKTEPVLVWSRGGGGFGLTAAEKYFQTGEMRLAYAWQSDHGSAEVDATTGELLSLNTYQGKSRTTPNNAKYSPWVYALTSAALLGMFLRWRLRITGKP